MRIPLEWLKEYVDYGNRTPDAVAELFSSSGTEVERIHLPEFDPDIVVAEVTAVGPHPNADRLRLATVKVGRKSFEVVCGAPNVAVGQKAALALPGTTVQGQVLQATTIRGAASEGMLLSERELGLSDDQGGILVLPETARTGQPVGEVLESRGLVIELSRLQANRPDKFGLIGLARELAAALETRTGKGSVKLPAAKLSEVTERTSAHLAVEVEDSRDVPAYLARIVEIDPGQPAPGWMVRRLEEAGLRSRSLPVDVTNYVMLETAQPLHAFDADLVRGAIRTRRAKKGERVRTLDGVERTLSPEILVIADDEGPIAIAGVMGGARTEVRETTSRVIIESANFDKTLVRKGALSLGLRSDASTRFEKGLPASFAAPALERAAALLHEHGAGKVLRGVVGAIPKQEKSHRIVLEDEVEQVGGVELSRSEIASALRAIGAEVTHSTSSGSATRAKALTCAIPPWRPDLRISEDLVEEVLRLVGYDRIPSRLSPGVSAQLSDPALRLRREVQSILVGAGAYEVKTYSFVSAQMLSRLGLEPAKHLKLENPKSPEQVYLRSELASRLLEVISTNRGYHEREPMIWELAHTFRKGAGARKSLEETELMVMRPGERSLRSLKGLLELLAERLHLPLEVASEEATSWWHPGRVAMVSLGGKKLGRIGEIHPRVLGAWKIRGRVAALQLDWAGLLEVAGGARVAFQDLPRFPEITRDISFDLQAEVPAATIMKEAASVRHVMQVHYQADLEAPGLKPGDKQVLLRVKISPDRTLTAGEVSEVEAQIQSRLKRRFRAKIRE
jgi:phenylalanyl-tRNA synthetase beta chain